jgi:ABC-2 type transport system ATP-binding protein
VIQARGLRKRFGRVKALDGLDLDVPAGAIYGFIGQNGAGKTTTIRVLATLMLPDEGEASVGGADVLRDPEEVRRLLGYVPDFFGVYDDLRVGEYLELYGQLHGRRGQKLRSARDDLLALVDLADKRDDYVEALSRGMQQRLCLARALVHDPLVLLLDEPASGLDPVARVEMRELLQELSAMGKTILISSHVLSELAELCSHVGMVTNGRLVREGPVAELLAAVERPRHALRVLRDAERAAAALEVLPQIGAVVVEGDVVAFRCGRGDDAAAALAAVVAAGVPVVRFGEADASLEATFVQLAREGVSA